MMTKKVKIFLIVLSIIISSSVGILAYNIAEQVRSGIVNTAAYYDIIIGPAGSSTQLAMNTMFFTDTPLGTISYEYVEELEADDRTNTVIPFAMGDSYNSARIIGTKPAFLEGKELAEGEMFHETFDAVVGSAVAKTYGISVGDKLVTSHGLSESGSSHESTPLTVTGILETTKTAYDNAVFTAKLALRNAKFGGILWHQGESNCKNCDMGDYREKFMNTMCNMRREFDALDLPLIVGEISESIGESWELGDWTRKFNLLLKELAIQQPCCAVASQEGLSLRPDGIHFDAKSCRVFGKRYFEQYITLVSSL